MLAIGRALIMDPKLIILDEPTEGLMPSIVKLVRDSVRTLNRTRGVAILLVEQNLETITRDLRPALPYGEGANHLREHRLR